MLKHHAVQEAFCHGVCHGLSGHERAVPTGARAAAARLPASTALKTALLGGLLVLIGLLVVLANRTPNLSNLRVAILSGSARGNYYAVVNALAAEARQQRGQIDNLVSAGSVENIARLVAAQTSCTIHFALVQDGMDWPPGQALELIGRLSKAESLVFLGPDADRIRTLTDLRGKRIGIGPIGSGTERVVRQLLAPFTELDLRLSTHTLDAQLTQLAARGVGPRGDGHR